MITTDFDRVQRLLKEQGEALGLSIENGSDTERFMLMTQWLKSHTAGTLLISGTFREIHPQRRTFDVTGEPLMIESVSVLDNGGKIIAYDGDRDQYITIQPVLNSVVNLYLRR